MSFMEIGMPDSQTESPECYLAHSPNAAGVSHRLKDHLQSVSALAQQFVADREWASEAALAGMLHDLGKYGDRFQDRLQGKDQGLDHWSQGAWLALTEHEAVAAALAIQGHHIGLQDINISRSSIRNANPSELERDHPLGLAMSDPDVNRLKDRLLSDGLTPKAPNRAAVTCLSAPPVSCMLDIRCIFSALVDADFLDTEAHFNGDARGKRYRCHGPALQAERSLAIVLDNAENLKRETKAPPVVQEARDLLLEACLCEAEATPGLFTLTAPTGSGKTLAMLAFALKHAITHDLRRVVMVIPYLSIIDQTAAIYSNLFGIHFGDCYVLEHHSLAGLGVERSQRDNEGQAGEIVDAERQRRLISENWDAPIIVTTSVQLLESLFSNRPSACRKLHRLSRSVILFDEVQTLPTHLAVPTLAALSHIAHAWGSTVVCSTATQPAFEHLHKAVKKYCASGWQPKEIVRESAQMFKKMRRVKFDWSRVNEPMSWDAVAACIEEQRQVLCIVNLKRHARALWEKLEDIEGVYHLSTNMCPLHRTAVLQLVTQRLIDGQPCRLIATQCIEAGVDLDFPVVWRARAPLPAIIQAAGRCNREGRLLRDGETWVFTPEDDDFPDSAYRQASEMTRIMLGELGPEGLDPYDPERVRQYYRRLYDLSNPEGQEKELQRALMDFDFPKIAQHYRLIKMDAINVLVPYGEALDQFYHLERNANENGLTARWIREARGLMVSLFRPKHDDPVCGGLIPVRVGRESSNDWFIYSFKDHYHRDLGLCPANSVLIG